MTFYKTTRIRERNRKPRTVNIGKACLTILWVALTLCACIGTASEGEEGTDALLQLTFNPDAARSRALSDGESTITDINVLVFNSAGALTGSAYATFSGGNYTMNVNARTGDGCSIYAIANTGSAAYFKGVATIADFKKKYVVLASDPAELGNASKTVMFGKKTGVKIDAQTAITAADNFALTRLCAKMSFTIKPAAGITVTGYQLCHVPMGSYITDETSTAYYNPPSAVFKDFSTVNVTTSAGTSVSGINYYMYENLAGKGTNTSAETRTATYAPINATYLIVYAKANDWHSTYRIYLGGANSSDYADYNIPRNYNYNYNIYINGRGGDARATYTLYEPAVGDYYYSDGTWGSNSVPPYNTTVIGIIFSTTVSDADQKSGWKHGYVMALTNAASNIPWSSNANSNIQEFPVSSDINTTTLMKADMDGYNHCQLMIKNHPTIKTDSSIYPAFYYTLNYGGTAIGGTKYSPPSNSSGWYLPSIGQWYLIIRNLGGIGDSYPFEDSTKFGLWQGTTNIATIAINKYLAPVNGELIDWSSSEGRWFWSSSEWSSNDVCALELNANDYICLYYQWGGYPNKNVTDKISRARAVLAF